MASVSFYPNPNQIVDHKTVQQNANGLFKTIWRKGKAVGLKAETQQVNRVHFLQHFQNRIAL